MKFRSTRGLEKEIPSAEAIINGIAKDGGLYVPDEFPKVYDKLKENTNIKYEELAFKVINEYFTDIDDAELMGAINDAYNNRFDVKVKNNFLELYHGPTCAFKDAALLFLPQIMKRAKKNQGIKEEVTILTATSGDTGKAALEGFAGVDGFKVVVYYPKNGVSAIQERQMSSQEGDNVKVIGIKGNFDDAQTGVKQIFGDDDFKAKLAQKGYILSSANSINIGRLVPQIVYYFYGYFNLVNQGVIKLDDKINVVVPTGNFGNILAAYYAKKMGIPIGKLICASNQNNVLTDFFENGTYDMNRPFYTTISPSMDILESSNFERFLYYISGEDSERTAGWMKDLKATGKLTVNEEEFKRIKTDFAGAYVDDEETKAIIEQVYNSYGYVMDPHTAVAMGAYMKELEKHPEDGARHTVIASTAHPFKFPTPICEALDIKVGETPYESLDNISTVTGVAFPKQLEALQSKPLRFTKAIDKENMKQEILDFVDTFSK